MTPLNPNAQPFQPRVPPHSTLTIATVNTCSWYNKIDAISNLVSSNNIDILGITETWLHDCIPDSALIPSTAFHIVRRDRPRNIATRGGGVSLLLRSSVKFIVHNELTPTDPSFEILCIELLKCTCPTFLFLCYRPPNQNVASFTNELQRILHKISPTAHIILMGDFNARLTAWNASDPDTREGRTGRTSSLLDLIATNQPHLLTNFSVLSTISDHCPVLADLRIQPLPPTTAPQTFFDYKRTNWHDLNDHLYDKGLSKLIDDAPDVDTAWEIWNTTVVNAISHYVPQSTRKSFPGNKPWFQSVHHKLRRRRDRLFASAKRSNCPVAWTAYRLTRNAFVNALRKAKRDYYHQFSDRLSGRGTYKWWRKVKTACNLDRPPSLIPDLVQNGISAQTDSSKADLLADLFSAVSQASNITTPLNLPAPSTSEVFSIKFLSSSTVFHTLSHLNIHTATTGGISNTVLRNTAEVTAISLTRLFNRCLTASSFPRDWKNSTITPVYKGSGAPSDPSNYRPISILNGVGKVYEHLVSKQFYQFVEDNDILSSNQYGFRRNRSTTDNLIRLTSSIQKSYDSRLPCDALFLDLRKARQSRSWGHHAPYPRLVRLQSNHLGEQFRQVAYHASTTSHCTLPAKTPNCRRASRFSYCTPSF